MTRATPSYRSRERRAGWSLVEMLCVITLTTLLTVMCIKFMILFMEIDSASGVQAMQELTLQRLEDQLRNDCNSATGAEITTVEEQPALVLRRGEAVVATYSVTGSRLDRLAANGSGPPDRDDFDLGPDALRLEAREEGNSIIVRVFTEAVVEGQKERCTARVEAVIPHAAAGDGEVLP